MPAPSPAIDRILDRITITEECWQWNGVPNSAGYAVVSNGPRLGLAHRIVYEHFVGPIPEGLTLDHLCRNRTCVNPDHLEAVTLRENLYRGEGWSGRNHHKTHCPAGHSLTGDNLVVQNGQRRCRKCRNEMQNARRRARLER